MKFRNLTGQKFQMLTAIEFVARTGNKTMWRFRCDCGTEKVLWGGNVSSGFVKSCGCWQKTNPARLTHGKTSTPTFKTWVAMRQRCNNPGNKHYKHYGGRGITICERWDEFENFLSDMGERPVPLTIDRYPDKNGNYEPGNCRWATDVQQTRNRRTTLMIEHDGETLPLQEWGERKGVAYQTLWHRYKVGDRGEHLFRPTV